jgi:hypothetical protein
MSSTTTALSASLVEAAYAALGTGDRATIEKYWHPEVTWQAAGLSGVSRSYSGLDEFIGFLTTMGELSGGSLRMEFLNILVGEGVAVALTHNTATRQGDPLRRLDIEEVHFLRWLGGRIVAGRGAMFGSGTAEFDRFVT